MYVCMCTILYVAIIVDLILCKSVKCKKLIICGLCCNVFLLILLFILSIFTAFIDSLC